MLTHNAITNDHDIRAALYARASTAQQAKAGAIDSQVEAILERARHDGVTIVPEARFLDDGRGGATLARPALQRLRDLASASGIDRLYVLCPDRLARTFPLQAVLVEELQRCTVEVVFLNSAADDNDRPSTAARAAEGA